MTIINNLIIYLAIVGLVFGGYKYMEFQNEKIDLLEKNLKNQKDYFESRIISSTFNAKYKERKTSIEKDINKDENNSVDIDSTRFYLN